MIFRIRKDLLTEDRFLDVNRRLTVPVEHTTENLFVCRLSLVIKATIILEIDVLLEEWGFRMVLPEGNPSPSYFLLHRIFNKTPSFVRNFARKLRYGMQNLISWSSAAVPSDLLITPDTAFVAMPSPRVFFWFFSHLRGVTDGK